MSGARIDQLLIALGLVEGANSALSAADTRITDALAAANPFEERPEDLAILDALNDARIAVIALRTAVARKAGV